MPWRHFSHITNAYQISLTIPVLIFMAIFIISPCLVCSKTIFQHSHLDMHPFLWHFSYRLQYSGARCTQSLPTAWLGYINTPLLWDRVRATLTSSDLDLLLAEGCIFCSFNFSRKCCSSNKCISASLCWAEVTD